MVPVLGAGSVIDIPAEADWQELVLAATLAPSPDNNQPWKFEVSAPEQITLYHDLTRALPSDENLMFSGIALGAALENLCIAARQRGWEPRENAVIGHDSPATSLSTRSPATEEEIAVIRFEDGARPDPLYPYLSERASCRKPYSRQPVEEASLRLIEAAASCQRDHAFHWLTDRAGINALAGLVASADQIRFEYPSFHAELFRQLRFSPQEAEASGDGLDVRCLEVPGVGQLLLRWLRSWPRMHALNRLGLSRLLGLQSALLVWCTGTIGLLTTKDSTRQGYLQVGRAFQRAWLAATKLRLAFHPLGSLPVFLSKLARGNITSLARHENLLKFISRKFFRLFPKAKNQGLVMLFRLGYGPGPSCRSLRRPVESVLRIKGQD